MVIAEAGSLANAVLAGAKTVMACIELRSAVSPAVLTSPAKVVSSGLCEAAVTTGSMLMAWKLPMPVAGTIPQSEPNCADSVMGWWEAMAWWEGLAAGAAEGVLLPQAAAVSARAPVMTPTAMAGLLAGLVGLVRMVSPVLAVMGAGGATHGRGPGPV